MPKVSFITGVKNRSLELKETIQSFIGQDMSDWEAIIVDDHSEEPIKEVVEGFKDDRLHYFKLPEGLTGISNARNFAVDYANSDILLTADGDDINMPDRASITYNTMIENDYDVFYSALNDYIPETNTTKPRKFHPFNEELFKMFNFMTNPSTAFKKSIFLRVGGFDPEFIVSEDYDLWLRMLNAGAKFGYTQKILVSYRCSSKSLSHQKENLMHEYIMKTRIKNNIPPFDIEDVKKYASPEFSIDILSESGRKLWVDDRYKTK